MGIKYLEKSEKALLKVFMAGGSVMYFILKWEACQLAMREYKYHLRWKYTKPTEENQKKLVEESEFKRWPFANYFFLREDGELDGVIDFCSVSGITIDRPPDEEKPKDENYWKAMTQMANVQSKFMQKMLDDMNKGDEWKGKDGGKD